MQEQITNSEPNWKNRSLFQGDNLVFLRAMNSESVALIATDPPFNKGRDFHATPESLAAGAKFQDRWTWENDVHQSWVDQITDDYPRLMEAIESARFAHSDGMGAYMCFMAVRLIEMWRVLRPTGSIYLHCDPTASHYLKAVMDAIFGWKNFKNHIIWHYQTGGAGKSQYAKKHDVILFYSKSDDFNFYPDRVRTGRTEKSMKRAQNPNGARISATDDTKLPMDVWTDIQALNPQARERTGYPTQKPVDLYERIISASSNEGDIVLDPFAGCATTLVAAERLNRQWVGIDIWKEAHKVVLSRLSDTTGIFGEVVMSSEPPDRTDDGDNAAPFLRVKQRVKEPEGPRWTRQEMYQHLLDQDGPKCRGCDREFGDSRYLELDHNTPRSDGGINHITNRVLLCSPCNRAKSNQLTLSGLRALNKKNGWMAL
jgi:site-specific DNA-methyltransferase (adenine-specific)